MPKTIISKNVGNRIRIKRKEQGLTLIQMAKILDISYQQLQKYESGSSIIAVDKLVMIAHVLNHAVEYFIQDVDLQKLSIGQAISADIVLSSRTVEMEVLLVEDNPNDAAQFRERALLSGHIKKIEVLHRLEDVWLQLQSLNANPLRELPDLIFMNLAIDASAVLQLIKRMKDSADLRHIPIILLTSHIQRVDLIRAYKLGVASYILKRPLYESHISMLEKLFDYWGNVVALQRM